MKTITKILAASLLLFIQCENKKTPSTNVLEKGFINPSTENRPLALWPWLNGFVDSTKLVYELEEMKDKGMRGALIWDLGALINPDDMIPAGPGLLGPESLQSFSTVLEKGSELGLDIGWVAASSWNAGGPWVEESNASMELLKSNKVVEGPSKQKIKIPEPISEVGEVYRYKHLTSMAIPHSESKSLSSGDVIILDEFVSNNQLIDWEVPEGKWDVISFFMSNTGQNLVVHSPNSKGLIIDHLSKKATTSYFDSILTRLEPVNQPESALKFLMLDSYEVWQMTDWSPQLIEEFKKRYKYDPIPYIPLLTGYQSSDTIRDERFRGDYHRLVSDMMIENHFAQSVEYGNKNGFEMITEAGHGGYPRVDPLKALGNSDIPMGEFWNRKRHWVTKEAASAAHIYGKELVAAESLTGWNNWQHGPGDFKQLFDQAFCEGLNQVVFHTFTHNPEMAGKPGFVYHAGEHINVNTTWWDMSKPFMDYLARCSYMLRKGVFVSDACLYYGDQAPNLVPPKRIDPNIKPIFPEGHCLHCGKPKPVDPGKLPGHDYDYINADIINSELKVNEGKLTLPSGQTYRVMLLPDKEEISLEVLRSLEKLVFEGAVILGRRPERTTSLENYPECDLEVKAIADKLWGKNTNESISSNQYGKGVVHWGKSLKGLLKEMDIRPDFEVEGTDNSDQHIDYIHRRTETEDIYFVTNRNPEKDEVICHFRVDNNLIPEIWDAETGTIQRNVTYKKNDNGISIELVLDPLVSRFVVFRDQSYKTQNAAPSDLQFGLTKKKVKSSMNLSTDWMVSFDSKLGGPESYNMEKLTDWSQTTLEGVKYYSGTATYSKEFTIKESDIKSSKRIYLEFENIQETARISINEEKAGIVWTPPYRIDITDHLKPGTNKINIDVINTWNNRIVGDLNKPEDEHYTKTNAKGKFKADGPLLVSGLIGETKILFY